MSDKPTTSASAYSVQCTHCQAVLKSPVPVPAGKTVKCPKCKQSFTTPGDGATKVESKTAVAPPPDLAPAPSVLDDDAEMAAAIAKLQGDGGLGAAAPSPPAPAKTEPAPAPPEEEIPEVDDDLVEPDEPGADDEVADVDIEADDDEPAKAKKKKKDDEEDEEPHSKKKKRRDEGDDDEDQDDEPRSKKKKRRDDEDEGDEPRSRKKKKKKAGSPMLLIGLIGGGVAALLLCCVGGGIGGYFIWGSATAPNIVGRWEQRDILIIPWEFRANGTGQLTAVFKINFTYSQSGDTLTVKLTSIEGVPAGAGAPKLKDRDTFRARVTLIDENTMRWEDLDGKERPATLHKVK